MEIKFFQSKLPTGFPSQAEDYVEPTLDLHERIVRHPAATFFIQVEGELRGEGIVSGDLLVVDRSLEVREGDLVVGVRRGEFVIERVGGEERDVWGVVTHVIHRTR